MTYEALSRVGHAPTGPIKAGYRHDIDGLRCVAVLLVVLFHFGLPDALRAGFMGVDIFYVISGYLIVPPIANALRNDAFSFRSFYERRIRRLAPGLLATTALTGAVAMLVLTPAELVGYAKEGIAAQLYVSNIYYWQHLSYFGLQANQSFLLHTWSLGVEEQFYITAPFLLWIAATRLRGKLVQIICVVGLCSFTLNLITVSLKPEATFYLLPTRAWEFCAGALVPNLITLAGRWRVPTAIVAPAGVALLVSSLAYYGPTTSFPGAFAVLPVLGTVLLIVAGADQGSTYSRVMSSAAPAYVGRISYELYLVHWPVKVFIPFFVLEPSYLDRVFGLALSFVLAAAIYHLVEAPVRVRRVLGHGRSLVAAYVGGTAVLLLPLIVAIDSGGLQGRLSPKAAALAAAANDIDTRFRSCEDRAASPCLIGRIKERPNWLVVGDSHADALAGAFSSYLQSRGEAGYFTFQSGCMPILDAADNKCRRFNKALTSFTAAHPEIQNIVLVSTWKLGDGLIGDHGAFVRGPAAVASVQRSLDRTLTTYRPRRVIVWLPVPGARGSVPSVLSRNLMWRRTWDLRITRAQYDDETQFLTKALLRHPEVLLIDPAKRLCSTGSCQILDRGRPLYYDNAHPAASQEPFFETIIREDLSTVP